MDIAQILRSEGFKVTPQRIAIYDALRGHHNHPTAEMIYHSRVIWFHLHRYQATQDV